MPHSSPPCKLCRPDHHAHAQSRRCGVCTSPGASVFGAASLQGAVSPPLISRHALYLALQLGGAPFYVPRLLALDVRRADERLIYGGISSSLHVPGVWASHVAASRTTLPWPHHLPLLRERNGFFFAVEELASALALPPPEWQAQYGLPKPSPSDPLVVYSRACSRAAWAAQLAADAGYER